MARQALILTEKDILEIDLNLVRLLKDSEGRCALLVDQDGRMLARKGFTKEIDCETLAALIAGSFASTRAMAKLIGESEFSVLFHQGERDHIHTILSVVFDDRTTIGMVRVYAKEIAERVSEILQYARSHNQADEETDYADLVDDASSRLDSMFGDTGSEETLKTDDSEEPAASAVSAQPIGGGRAKDASQDLLATQFESSASAKPASQPAPSAEMDTASDMDAQEPDPAEGETLMDTGGLRDKAGDR
jgi:predicted regulator of Ras-like GTPase activity (Roadblock/LC7/MglB family)